MAHGRSGDEIVRRYNQDRSTAVAVRAYLLRVPSPAKHELARDVGDLDFVDDGPHVAGLRATKFRLAVTFGAGNGEMRAC